MKGAENFGVGDEALLSPDFNIKKKSQSAKAGKLRLWELSASSNVSWEIKHVASVHQVGFS
jgi:hypothetical protein